MTPNEKDKENLVIDLLKKGHKTIGGNCYGWSLYGKIEYISGQGLH
jgi:hypothetical protein